MYYYSLVLSSYAKIHLKLEIALLRGDLKYSSSNGSLCIISPIRRLGVCDFVNN